MVQCMQYMQILIIYLLIHAIHAQTYIYIHAGGSKIPTAVTCRQDSVRLLSHSCRYMPVPAYTCSVHSMCGRARTAGSVPAAPGSKIARARTGTSRVGGGTRVRKVVKYKKCREYIGKVLVEKSHHHPRARVEGPRLAVSRSATW